MILDTIYYLPILRVPHREIQTESNQPQPTLTIQQICEENIKFYILSLAHQSPFISPDLKPRVKDHLNALAKRSSPLCWLKALNEKEVDKTKMTNTLVKIGECLETHPNKPCYHGKKINQRQTYPFYVDSEELLIVQGFVGRVTNRKVNDFLDLNTLRIDKVRIMAKNKPNNLSNVSRTLYEVSLLKLFQTKGLRYFTPPFLKYMVQTRKFIGVAKKYPLNGKQLANSTVSAIRQLQIFKCNAIALSDLHAAGFVHSDFNPGNFLMDESSSYLTDFEHVKKIGENFQLGTPFYVPPEYCRLISSEYVGLRTLPISEKFDSYSMGVSIVEIVANRDPEGLIHFACFTQQQITDYIRESQSIIDHSALSSKEKIIKQKMLDVAHDLMKYDPNQRISCAQAVKDLDAIDEEANLQLCSSE